MKNKNTILRRHAAPALAALALIAASCSQEITDPQLPDNGQSTGKMITVTAIAPGSGNDSQTRTSISEMNDVLTVVWRGGDTFALINESGDVGSERFTLEEGSKGSKNGIFTGEAPSPGSYIAFLPVKKADAATLIDLYIASTYEGQEQSKNGNTEHLGGFDYCQSNSISDFTQPIAFSHSGCVFRFALTMPAAGTPQTLTLSTEEKALAKNLINDKTDALTLTFKEFDAIDAGGELKAYMMMYPEIKNTSAGNRPIMTLTLTCADAVYSCKVQMRAEGYTAGQTYDFAIAAENWKKELSANEMQFSIITTNADESFTLPFVNSGTTGTNTLTVNWGDGHTTTIDPDTSLEDTDANTTTLLTHQYVTPGTHQITIASSQMDITQVQMPDFKPGYYRRGTDYANCKMLTSMDSPMLNTGQLDFKYCFWGCEKLATIPATLFDKNTGITSFDCCFQNCKALTAIHAGLFAKHTAAKIFSYCFSICENLAAIPATLFDKNTNAESFTGTFSTCKAITAIPATLFVKNTNAKSFTGTFGTCEGLGEIPTGLFDTNTEVTTFENSFMGCISLTAIPAGLFAKNLKVTKFAQAFYGCTKVTLNADIFCNESSNTEGKQHRFASVDANINFTGCFRNCGSDASVADGDGGTAPALWDYTYAASKTPTKTNCFNNVTKVTNAGSIDLHADWK